MNGSQLKTLADAARVVPPAYTTLQTAMQAAANAGGYTHTVSTASLTNRILSELYYDNISVRDLGNGNSELSWR